MESDANVNGEEEMEMEMGRRRSDCGRAMFVSTNLGTHLIITTHPSDTVKDLRGKVRNGHLFCFPHFGEIDIVSLMVKHESLFYYLPDSIFVEAIFHGLNGTRYLSVEISGSNLHNEKAVPQPNIGNGSLLKKCCSSELQLNEKALSNRQCTDSVTVTEKKEMIHEEIAKELKTLGSGDKSLHPSSNRKSKKNRKEVHDHNEDLSVHVLSQNNKKNRRKQTTEEMDNIVDCSSGQVFEKIKRDEKFIQGHSSRQEKVSILNSTKDDSFKDLTVTTNNSSERKNPLRNLQDISTAVDGENPQGREWTTGKKHGKNSKAFCEEDSLHGAKNKSGGLQGKADDARDCHTDNKLKCKRKQSSHDVVDDNEKISTKDVNDVPQISENVNLQGNEYVRTEQTPVTECGAEKLLNHKRKRSSKKVLDCDQEGFVEDVNGKPETTKHKNCLEYECRKREDICDASVVPGKNAQTKDTNGVPVRYVDVVSHTEFNQQCNISGKRKSKRSRNDSSSVDGEEKITTKKEINNDTLVGKTNDGLMNREKSKKAISHQKEKKSNKPTNCNHSKKNHMSLFRSDSDESTDVENPNYSQKMRTSSKRISDSSDSYDSDAGGTKTILKSESIRTQGDWEPSRSGALLSTAVGKAEDNGGNGSVHSKFVHLLSKKTSLGELFKIARPRRQSESEQFGGRFMIDESPSVDMVLETQDSQCDPIGNLHNNRVLPAFPIVSNQTNKDGKTSIEASKDISA